MYILLIIIAYFGFLLLISHFTAGKGDNKTFFTANRQSPWFVVAFGMLGASLSGVTFISVPGWVGTQSFAYMQMVLGYLAGYAVITFVLLPLYYRLNLISIYTYLQQRFGSASYQTGASFFLLSRMLGSAFRLYLVAMVLQLLVFDALGLPFWMAVSFSILLIWLYTFRGGIKTIIYTDTLQTLFMLLSLGFTLYFLAGKLLPEDQSFVGYISSQTQSKIFFFDNFRLESRHFIKQFIAGMLITITMTGLDQDMMQKNLTCKNLREAQKNMLWFSVSLVPVNLLFLILGVFLYQFAALHGIDASGDALFPSVVFSEVMPTWLGIIFLLGLTAAAYSSADSALTAMTTSFCVDILDIDVENKRSKRTRLLVHMGISILLALVVIIFRYWVNESVIEEIFTVAGFTYGPLLGLFAFGLISKKTPNDKIIPFVAVLAPLICVLLRYKGVDWFGYRFSFELLLINGLITYFGLWLVSLFIRKKHEIA